MRTSARHYEEADRLIREAGRSNGDHYSHEKKVELLLEAQVHATLSIAAR